MKSVYNDAYYEAVYKNHLALPEFAGFHKSFGEMGTNYDLVANDRIFVSEDADGEDTWYASRLDGDYDCKSVEFPTLEEAIVGAVVMHLGQGEMGA
jgi:hypothetical protein